MVSKTFKMSVCLILAGIFTGFAAAGSYEPQLMKECPGGKLYQVGPHRVLLLSGEPYRMGYAHGKLLADDIKQMTRMVLGVCRASDSMREKDFFAGSIEKAWERIKPFIPQRYLDEMKGVSDGSGVPLEDIQLANVFPALFHCSGFALFGKATQDGRLLHGRVLDYMTQIGLQTNAVTIIQSPNDYNSFVNVSYAGFIGSATGMNFKKVAIGEMGGGGEGQWDGLTMPLLFRKALEEADTLGQAVDVFKNTPRTCEYYYVVSDGKIKDALGLYCTPEIFEVIKPGQQHPKLPEVVDDAVLFSAADRYKHLVDRVKKGYGKIGVQDALDLMLYPVAMKSNLHDVLFAPETLELWIAHAGPDPTKEKYQACYQEYVHINLNDFTGLMPAPADEIESHSWKRLSDAIDNQTAISAKPVELSGTVPATLFRPIRNDSDPEMNEALEKFQEAPASFDWNMKLKRDSGSFVVYDVQFPSAYESPVEQNNTVHCEYFVAQGGQEAKPAVIVLHILDGKFMVARLVCQQLASAGINAIMVKLPYYGERRPVDTAKFSYLLESPEALANGVIQGVIDVRRTARWLGARKEVDPNKIGLVGVSLGGFVAATSAGVDGFFPKVATIIAGGNLPKVFEGNSKEVQTLRQGMDNGEWSQDKINDLLAPIDPLTFALRLKASSSVFMINASEDQIVPVQCARELADASGAKLVILPADHYKIAVFLPMIMNQITGYFSQW